MAHYSPWIVPYIKKDRVLNAANIDYGIMPMKCSNVVRLHLTMQHSCASSVNIRPINRKIQYIYCSNIYMVFNHRYLHLRHSSILKNQIIFNSCIVFVSVDDVLEIFRTSIRTISKQPTGFQKYFKNTHITFGTEGGSVLLRLITRRCYGIVPC